MSTLNDIYFDHKTVWPTQSTTTQDSRAGPRLFGPRCGQPASFEPRQRLGSAERPNKSDILGAHRRNNTSNKCIATSSRDAASNKVPY